MLARLGRSASRVPSISGYESLHELRRGGQGVVYSAVQRSTKRKVAVKVLLAGSMATPVQQRRFEREVEVAASLRHPNIVRVFDSGLTPDGMSFLVMEFVEGQGLADSIRGAPADAAELRARVALFATIAAALSYAHQRGVIHRDLKPSNVRIDASGEPRLLDFGLAKVLGQASGEGVEVSQSGEFLGSLPWASPEQAEGDLHAIDVRSDVYSLGVMLYQAITGKLPYDTSSGISAALASIKTAVPATLGAVPGLDEDLRTIILKCLSKEPERRYQSATDVAGDLRSWLAGEPIAARRDSAWYTLRSTARRYRRAAWLGGVFAAVVSGLLVVTLRSLHAAGKERDAARTAGAQSQASVEFLGNLLTSADPDAPGGGLDLKVIDALAKAPARIDKDFANDPAVRVSLYRLLGSTYANLGQFEQSEASLVRAVAALHERGAPPDDPVALSTRADLCSVRIQTGRFEQVLGELEEIAAAQRANPQVPRENTISSYSDIGMAYRHLRQPEPAEKAFAVALEVLGADQFTTDAGLNTSNNLAGLYVETKRYDQAERLYRDVIAGYEKLLGPEHRQTMLIRSNLGLLLMDQGRYADAEALLKPAYESSIRVRGADHPTTLTLGHNFGTLEHRLKNLDEADRILSDTLARRRALLGDGADFTLMTLGNLAFVLADKKEFERATRLSAELVDRRIATKGERSLEAILALNTHAQMLFKNSDEAAAEPVFARAVALACPEAGVLKDPHYVHGIVRSSRGRCLTALGRVDEAEVELLAALDVLKRTMGETHEYTRRAAGSLVSLYEEWGKPGKAEAFRALAPQAPQPASAPPAGAAPGPR